MSNCHCPDPPGGEVECEPGQLAMCTIKNGKVLAKCATPPKGASGLALHNWVLSMVYDQHRDHLAPLSEEDKRILEWQTYESFDGSVLITFRIP